MGVCSVGRPPDGPQCMGVCLKDFSVAQSYPDTHLFGILEGVTVKQLGRTRRTTPHKCRKHTNGICVG